MGQAFLQPDQDIRPQPRAQHLALGLSLVESGRIAPWQLFFARQVLRRQGQSLIDVLRARDWITPPDARDALAAHYGLATITLPQMSCPSALGALMPPALCLALNTVPCRIGRGPVFLVSGAPERLLADRTALPSALRRCDIVVATPQEVETAIADLHRPAMVQAAETRTAADLSYRNDRGHRLGPSLFLACAALLALAFLLAPRPTYEALTYWAMFSLLAVSAMKLAAFVTRELTVRTAPAPSPPADLPLPRISVMVPLYKEEDIAHALVRRLCRLTYPKMSLEVLLVLEEHDDTTRQTLARTALPNWMKIVTVPAGSGLTTKPRALNYALDFCKGDIIGIWDAEDAPAPDQLEIVAAAFANAAPEVVCLQGVLDYYNPGTNWISRCFTIEYAAWFRVILPGLARLGLPVPLGGTTLFLRRAAIEEMGGWDAHNVTEDADLGIRIARFGYRTELIPTVTHEEANHQPRAWIKQRSRWLKGFMVTWLVHMRAPLRLWREVGIWHMLGLQLVFACTLSQFLLAPLIWLFWADAFGIPLALGELAPPGAALLFLVAGLSDVVIFIRAALHRGSPRLIPWVFALGAYFPLATLAAYKGLYELVLDPFYWDKTAHGKTREATEELSPTPGIPGAAG